MKRISKFACLTILVLPHMAPAQEVGDSTGWTPRTVVRAAFLTSSLKRAASLETGPVSTSSATMIGGEFWALDKSGSGLMLRYARGSMDGATSSLSSGDMEYIDARVFVGVPEFAVILGGMSRTSVYNGENRRFLVPRAGIQSGYTFAGTGVTLRVAGSYVRTVKKESSDSVEANGLEGETSILYVPPRLPFYVELGYRRELWNLKKESLYVRREELGGLVFLVGLQTGLSTR